MSCSLASKQMIDEGSLGAGDCGGEQLHVLTFVQPSNILGIDMLGDFGQDA